MESTNSVSSPYRYSNNARLSVMLDEPEIVSSPYRYSNNVDAVLRWIVDCKFQVLIGILTIKKKKQSQTVLRNVSSPYRYSNNLI